MHAAAGRRQHNRHAGRTWRAHPPASLSRIADVAARAPRPVPAREILL
jgi:hypothetical protein